MANENVNKVIYGDTTLLDLTQDSVSPNTLLEGETAHDRSGTSIVGTAKQGHTIVDPSNTSMAQEGKLQFATMQVTDDSTNGKTVVRHVVQLTQAQYDALPSSKLTDNIIYEITDGNSTQIQAENVGYGNTTVAAELTEQNSSLTDQQGEVDAILDVYGAKNIMPFNPLLSNGSVSCSVQENGTARYNGSTSVILWFGITQPTGNPVGDTYTTLLRKGTYKFIVKSSQALSSNVQVALFSPAATTIKNFSSGTNNKYEFTLSADTYVYVGVRFAANTSPSNFDIQAYIIDARVKDESFVDCAMTNRELTEVKAGTVSTTYTWNGSLEKCGNLCVLTFSVTTGSSEIAANTTLITVPYKPKNAIYFLVRSNIDGLIKLATINTNGNVSLNVALPNGGSLLGEAVYFSY